MLAHSLALQTSETQRDHTPRASLPVVLALMPQREATGHLTPGLTTELARGLPGFATAAPAWLLFPRPRPILQGFQPCPCFEPLTVSCALRTKWFTLACRSRWCWPSATSHPWEACRLEAETGLPFSTPGLLLSLRQDLSVVQAILRTTGICLFLPPQCLG